MYYVYLALWRVFPVIARYTEGLFFVHHVAIPAQRFVILETAKVRQMPILVLGHSILPTENNLHKHTIYVHDGIMYILHTLYMQGKINIDIIKLI